MVEPLKQGVGVEGYDDRGGRVRVLRKVRACDVKGKRFVCVAPLPANCERVCVRERKQRNGWLVGADVMCCCHGDTEW